MISSGANPITCDAVVNDAPCGAPAAYVFKTAHVMRLMCFDCAQRYRAANLKPPPLEFALLELIPAREVLEMELKTTQSKLTVANGQSKMSDEKLAAARARMTAMADLGVAERRLLFRLTMGVLVVAGLVFGVLSFLSAAAWTFYAPMAILVLGEWGVRRWVDRVWLKPRLKKIDQDFMIARWS